MYNSSYIRKLAYSIVALIIGFSSSRVYMYSYACTVSSGLTAVEFQSREAGKRSHNSPISPYARNLSSDVMAIPVIGPVVSSDWMISQNGFRNVIASIVARLGALFNNSWRI